MKDGYIYYPNGKVIISDDNENEDKRVYKEDEKISDNVYMRDYQDNIDEILVTENMIEELDSRYINTLKRIEIGKKELKNHKHIAKIFVIFNTVLLLMMPSLLATHGLISAIIGLLVSNSVFALSTLIVEVISKHTEKKELNANQIVLDKITEELKGYEKKLSQLKKNKTKNNEEQMKKSIYKKVDYIKQLEELKKQLVLFYNIGYDENKLERFYNKDVLEEKLGREYTEEEINNIKTYFKKK